MNFKNHGDNSMGDGLGGKPPANVTLVRRPSIYSLTFDEFQGTMGGVGNGFGSMNMDELLKNIWIAEETQALASSTGGGDRHTHNPGGNLQRQGSLTLPRTLSQKTVDDVWRDLIKDSDGAEDGCGNGVSTMPQRQQTIGEMTLEEFLVRAGVVREDMPQQIGRPNANGNGWFGDFSRSNNNTGLLVGFQQPTRSNGDLGNKTVEASNPVSKQPPTSLNTGASKQQAQEHQPPHFPKTANVAFAAPMHLLNNAEFASHGTRGGIIGVPEHSMSGPLVQSNALPGVGKVGLAQANGTAAAASPASQISPDVITKSSVDTSSLSPVSCVTNRGRKCSAIEKLAERRQRRMIKNRESAARSRARKQISANQSVTISLIATVRIEAYTSELEAEVAQLKELNQELQRKQADIMEMQKNQASDAVCRPWGGSKRQCLRRTFTGPW